MSEVSFFIDDLLADLGIVVLGLVAIIQIYCGLYILYYLLYVQFRKSRNKYWRKKTSRRSVLRSLVIILVLFTLFPNALRSVIDIPTLNVDLDNLFGILNSSFVMVFLAAFIIIQLFSFGFFVMIIFRQRVNEEYQMTNQNLISAFASFIFFCFVLPILFGLDPLDPTLSLISL